MLLLFGDIVEHSLKVPAHLLHLPQARLLDLDLHAPVMVHCLAVVFELEFIADQVLEREAFLL